MGKKYTVMAFDFPYKSQYDRTKQTRSLIVALTYFIIWNFKYFGVTIEKRG
jgi:hypothetical protein